MTPEEKRLSDLACDWREKFQLQLARAVAAEERAGKKNVARLEARIAELERREALRVMGAL
jgi:phage-related protein